MTTKMNVKWFAKGGGISKAGPFNTQEEAVNVMRLAPQKTSAGNLLPCQKLFPDDVFVWPETVDDELR